MCAKCIISVSKVHDHKGFSQSVELVSSANAKTRQWLAGEEDCAKQTWCMGRSVARFTWLSSCPRPSNLFGGFL